MDIVTVPGCAFCCAEDDLTVRAPLSDAKDNSLVPCDRWIYKDAWCIVTLDPAQLSRGHALAVLRNHRCDLSDAGLFKEEHHALIDAAVAVAATMKQRLPCERVYVATLCDGVEHLHYHLIPRYATDIRGFAFIGQREFARRAGYIVGPDAVAARVAYLEDIARLLRLNDA